MQVAHGAYVDNAVLKVKGGKVKVQERRHAGRS